MPTLPVSASGNALSKKVRHYEGLLKEVAQTLKLGRERAQEALEREKTRTYWEVGKLIDSHVLQSGERGDYGKKVIKRLAADLKTNQTLLYYALQFARAYPEIPGSEAMTWSHYRALLPVKDEDKRRLLEEQTEELGWSSRRLEAEVLKQQRGGPERPAAGRSKAPERLNVRRIASGGGEGHVLVDLGFSIYIEVPSPGRGFTAGMLVTVKGPAGKCEIVRGAALQESDLFAYQALVEDVLPSGKVRLLVDLGTGMMHRRAFSWHGEAPDRALLQSAALKRRPLKARTWKDPDDRYSVELFGF